MRSQDSPERTTLAEAAIELARALARAGSTERARRAPWSASASTPAPTIARAITSTANGVLRCTDDLGEGEVSARLRVRGKTAAGDAVGAEGQFFGHISARDILAAMS